MRSYFKCSNCNLIFVSSEQHIPAEKEKQHYDLHENSPTDVRYRNFLTRISAPLLERLPKCASGLDFGCGPGPTLSVMLSESGHNVDLYDVNYFKNENVWKKQYDFITATEVIEHLRDPRNTLLRLASLIKPNGLLAVMTQITDGIRDLSNWHYMRDPTHIQYFHSNTFQHITSLIQAEMIFQDQGVVIFRIKR